MLNWRVFLLTAVALVGGQQQPGQKPVFGPNPRPARQSAASSPPYLEQNHDLINFALSEDASVGSVVYTLKGVAGPDGGKVLYTISGDHFSVDRVSGDIRLREKLDREREDLIDVVLTIQDASDPNHIIPFRRTIRVLDVNDNIPEFIDPPYSFSVDETVAVGETLFTALSVRDHDGGSNAEIELSCVIEETPEACDTFDIQSKAVSQGSYIGLVMLKKPLDFEARSSYDMVIRATDKGRNVLSATANILIQVNDVQDQAPVFLNAPYSTTVPENVVPGTVIFEIQVRDGDTGRPREILLELLGDTQKFFQLDVRDHDRNGVLSAALVKSADTLLDREQESILAEGGLYAFQIRATEKINDRSNGESVTTNVTLIITDVDDQIPSFNRNNITVAVPEDVGPDTPLPDLNLVVMDGDVSRNAEFELVLESEADAEGIFSVHPTHVIGRAPVIIRVVRADRLDYESPSGKVFHFKINAVQGPTVFSSVHVTVLVTDSNDNAPVFSQLSYDFNVPENAKVGDPVGQITATDVDSGRFGQVEYDLQGFGAEKFKVNQETGEIFVSGCSGSENEPPAAEGASSCLDFESQSSYFMTYTGTDGGGQVSTTSLNIRLIDVNDNYPQFDLSEYRRVVEEGATHFQPPLTVRATDLDGPAQGAGQVFYSIKSVNTDATVFNIDPITGEVSIVQPIKYSLASEGKFSLVVRATDMGKPALHSDVKISIEVGSVKSHRPVFTQAAYNGSVRENALPGDIVLTVKANDPDDLNASIRYDLDASAKDNFLIDPASGVISVAKDSVLDIQSNGDLYEIKVTATSYGQPLHRSSEAVVVIHIEDINDKKPTFDKDTYVMYVLESLPVGEPVLKVQASDLDRTAMLEYALVEPIAARDKTGNALTNRAAYDFASAFSIDPRDGQISINQPLNYNSAAVIILTVQVTDKNGHNTSEEEAVQRDQAEVTFYIESYKADSPQFSAPWTPSDPHLEFLVKEQEPVGKVLFRLTAKDPVTGMPISQFEKLPSSEAAGLIDISPLTGEVISNQVLDFEDRAQLEFQVRARAVLPGHEDRFSDANVVIRLLDVNDNAPVFEHQEYSANVSESALPKSLVITVKAMDKDTGEYGRVFYKIVGEGSDVFSVDPQEGHIQVRSGPSGRSLLDREVQDQYELTVVALDMPSGGPDQRSTSTKVIIHVLDTNDTPPKFSRPRYSAVVPENSPEGTGVVQVNATDPDLRENGQLSYEFADTKSLTSGQFTIDAETGKIVTVGRLTGKGRHEPYVLAVRAVDKGSPELFTDVEVYVTVGDVSSNDGVPTFVRPALNEVAFIPENAEPGTNVFQVEAIDPDDPNTASGKLVYSLPDDGTIVRKLFQMDPVSGVLSTRAKLDRELRSNYTLILDVSDLGSPAQQTSRLLSVVVQDVDDHAPKFNRQKNSVPMELKVEEELPVGSEVGWVLAVDQDEGDNAVIEYSITDGNDDHIFDIHRGATNNRGIISLKKRLDREECGLHLLTVRCFRPYEKGLKAGHKKYDSTEMDLMQIRVVVLDKDDNHPKFLMHNQTLGVRVNSPIFSDVATLVAVDADADAEPVHYKIENITFFRPRSKEKEILDIPVFLLDEVTGVLRTNQTYGQFTEGFFLVVAKAFNAPDKFDFARMKIFVLQDTDLMRFVFNSDPTSVQRALPEFSRKVELAFPQPLRFDLFDPEFYSQVDGSLDFGRTSSCFQIMEESNSVVDPQMSERLFEPEHRSKQLNELLDQYSVISIERCAHISPQPKVNWVEVFLLVIAVLIGLLSLIAAIVICCLYRRYRRNTEPLLPPIKIIEAPVRAYIPASMPPGSMHSGVVPSLYDWQESTIPMDAASYRSLPNA